MALVAWSVSLYFEFKELVNEESPLRVMSDDVKGLIESYWRPCVVLHKHQQLWHHVVRKLVKALAGSIKLTPRAKNSDVLHLVLEYYNLADVRVPYKGNINWGTQQCECHPCNKHWQRQHGPLRARYTEIHHWFTSGYYVQKSTKKVQHPLPHDWTYAEEELEVPIWREELKKKNYNDEEIVAVLGHALIDLTEI